MELTAQLPAMLAVYTQAIAVRRKDRNDRRRYWQRMKRNHGGSRRERQAPPDA